jgi:penicillin G amidase
MLNLTAVLAPIIKAGLSWISRRRLPTLDGTLQLPGLQAPVEVLRDRWGVPHLYAQTPADLFMAQGFVHAQDRLWQMEMNRRLAAGRLAEVLGAAAVETDRQMRTLLLRRVAEQEVALLSVDTRSLLKAYAAGVNAYIAQGRLPVEFTLLRARPEPWSPADTISWTKVMAWHLCADARAEAHRAKLVERLGEALVAELAPPYLPHWPRVMSPGTRPAGSPGVGEPMVPASTEGLGSNNWVVAGVRTATGSPLLANDMHLGLTIPSIWYENHLVAGELDVTGVTFPGIPGVISGHNGHVAWGLTDGLPDVQDLTIERLHPTADGRVEVEYQGERYEAEVLHEQIRVKGGEPVGQDIIVTRHGPISNALFPELGDDPPLALRWTSLEPCTMMDTLTTLMQARTCREFREALRGWASPVQNFVYADVEGNIGYSFPGLVPIRARGDGRLPVPGWTDACEWVGTVPFEELPHLENPPAGYIASANNAVVDDAYPYDLAVRPSSGNRALRIVELLESREKIDITYMQRMHLDLVSPLARTVVGYLRQLQVDETLEPAAALLRNWDGALSADSAAGALYQLLLREMASLMLSKALGDDVPLGDRTWWWLEHTLAQPTSRWFDQGHGETRDDVMRLALARALAELRSTCGPAPEDWAWGKLHRMTYGHVLGRNRFLAPVFNRGPFEVGGDGHTVCACNGNLADPTSFTGAPYRMIVDLGDLRNSVSVLTPGQSGHLGSPHYDDQIAAWTAGAYHPMLYAREDVEREAVHWLRLSGH